MSAQHTPGPWKVLEHSWSDTSIVAEGFDHGICLLDINYATEESQEADEAQMAANARLIAAAPDLLAVLQTIVRVADGRQISGNLILDENSPLMDAARDAINKATGSAS